MKNRIYCNESLVEARETQATSLLALQQLRCFSYYPIKYVFKFPSTSLTFKTGCLTKYCKEL